jgi:hypothetical protein
MKLQQLRGCEGSDCPKVYETDRGSYIVQGDVVNDAGVLAELGLPEGETAVEVPRSVLAGLPTC